MKKIAVLLLLIGSLQSSFAKHLYFTENMGQVLDQNKKPNPNVLFSAKSGSISYHFKAEGWSYQLQKAFDFGKGQYDKKMLNLRSLKN